MALIEKHRFVGNEQGLGKAGPDIEFLVPGRRPTEVLGGIPNLFGFERGQARRPIKAIAKNGNIIERKYKSSP